MKPLESNNIRLLGNATKPGERHRFATALPTTERQQTAVSQVREVIAKPEADYHIFEYVTSLRSKVESIEKYRAVKHLAENEINSLPDDILTTLLKRAEPFIRALPAGHSKGHISRDLVHLTEVLHDPDARSYDNVEILIGILGGVFHDIGNSVIDRDTEGQRFTLHAEVGSWLVGNLFQDLLPPNILTLTQFAIAAHTKFQQPQKAERNGVEITRIPYDTTIVGNDKRSLALTRTACRTDLQSGGILPARHLLHAVKASNFYLATGELRKSDQSDGEDSAILFMRDAKNPDALLNFFQKIVDNSVNPSWHSVDDTPYLRNELFGPNIADLQLFINRVTQPTSDVSHTDEERAAILKKFFRLSHLIEPGSDITHAIQIVSSKFDMLDTETRDAWITGFDLINSTLYPSYFQRMREHIQSTPQFAIERDGKVETIVKNIHVLANRVLDSVEPYYLDKEPADYPDVMNALLLPIK